MTVLPAWLTRVRALLLNHNVRHEDGGLDEINLEGLNGMPGDLAAHASRHEYGGADEIGNIKFTSSEKTANYTATATDLVIYVDAASIPAMVTLPAAASHTNKIYYVKKIDSSGHRVTIDGNESETIDGEQTVELTLQYSYVLIHCDGDEWHIIGGGNVKMEDILSDLLNEQITLLRKLLTEIIQSKLHLASMSDENVTERDVDG